MKSKTTVWGWVIAIVVIVVIVAAAWYWRGAEHPAPERSALAPASTVAPAAAATAVRHPIAMAGSAPAPATSAPAPTLAGSDAAVTQALTRLGGGAPIGKWLVNQHIIERIVATVNALPQRELSHNILPLEPPAGAFKTRTVDGKTVLDTADYARYAPYVRWLQQADTAQVVDWYVQSYPLFQQAYEQLGYPDGYFNDRLVTVIEHLLAAPEPTGPIALVAGDHGYAFADPQLENLSAGQKLMVRVGPDNEKLIKQKLRVLLAAVTGAKVPAPAAAASAGG